MWWCMSSLGSPAIGTVDSIGLRISSNVRNEEERGKCAEQQNTPFVVEDHLLLGVIRVTSRFGKLVLNQAWIQN